jgi:hypothetical protein
MSVDKGVVFTAMAEEGWEPSCCNDCRAGAPRPSALSNEESHGSRAAEAKWRKCERCSLRDRIAHMQAAARVPFPAMARRAPVLEPDLLAAVKHNVRLLAEEGSPLAEEQERRQSAVRRISLALHDFDTEIKRGFGYADNVAAVAENFHVALAASLIDAMGYPDENLIVDMVRGMDVVGQIPTTGLFRQIQRTASEAEHLERAEADFRETSLE